jgi:hypothetical protein
MEPIQTKQAALGELHSLRHAGTTKPLLYASSSAVNGRRSTQLTHEVEQRYTTRFGEKLGDGLGKSKALLG